MLEQLYIKNVALIEEAQIKFGPGFNILTGETGAGKSMVIDSLNFALGERSGKDFIRSGVDFASVEAVFSPSVEIARAIFELVGIGDEDEENIVIILRTMNSQGKTSCKINGRSATASMLKEIGGMLIDMHGQHEHQSLLNPMRHIKLLDEFCAPSLLNEKKELEALCAKYISILKEIKEYSKNEKEKEHRMELLSFQKDEIAGLELKEDEEEYLSKRRDILSNSEKLKKLAKESLNLIYDGGSDSLSAADQISKALGMLYDMAKIDSAFSEFANVLDSVYTQINDVSREMKSLEDSFESDPDELDYVLERINAINKLKRKYGGGIKEIIRYHSEISNELENMVLGEKRLAVLNAERKELLLKIKEVCGRISDIRKATAKVIEKDIEKNLRDLEMKDARFEVSIEQKHEFSANGWDKVEFFISPNKGEEIKPLSRIVSGGEMSRIMLAMKSVLADADNIETFIFDEIDAGVSGKTAQSVGEKMAVIAKNRQIICITHLPQIASMADVHFLIEKNTEGERTKTNVLELDYNESIEEISRLIGGANITDAVLTAAGDMKSFAGKFKSSF
ncbi:MAG: DNA repair protein RecN [Lachnospiraceae bacterium]|nr:DNA repair protein RecN [Lachnospiraceae bacterium]